MLVCFAAALLMLCYSIVFKKGTYDPINKDKDTFVVIVDEMQYAADKLGISWK